MLKAQFTPRAYREGFHGARVAHSRCWFRLRIPGGNSRGDLLEKKNEGDRKGPELCFRPFSFVESSRLNGDLHGPDAHLLHRGQFRQRRVR